jgi:hypothetical protein
MGESPANREEHLPAAEGRPVPVTTRTPDAPETSTDVNAPMRLTVNIPFLPSRN